MNTNTVRFRERNFDQDIIHGSSGCSQREVFQKTSGIRATVYSKGPNLWDFVTDKLHVLEVSQGIKTAKTWFHALERIRWIRFNQSVNIESAGRHERRLKMFCPPGKQNQLRKTSRNALDEFTITPIPTQLWDNIARSQIIVLFKGQSVLTWFFCKAELTQEPQFECLEIHRTLPVLRENILCSYRVNNTTVAKASRWAHGYCKSTSPSGSSLGKGKSTYAVFIRTIPRQGDFADRYLHQTGLFSQERSQCSLFFFASKLKASGSDKSHVPWRQRRLLSPECLRDSYKQTRHVCRKSFRELKNSRSPLCSPAS